jgi:hypothetical protein
MVFRFHATMVLPNFFIASPSFMSSPIGRM